MDQVWKETKNSIIFLFSLDWNGRCDGAAAGMRRKTLESMRSDMEPWQLTPPNTQQPFAAALPSAAPPAETQVRRQLSASAHQ